MKLNFTLVATRKIPESKVSLVPAVQLLSALACHASREREAEGGSYQVGVEVGAFAFEAMRRAGHTLNFVDSWVENGL
jgi:hypothetical protein